MPSPQILETVSVADAATTRLRDSLFAGHYKAGEEIKDTHVATQFGIARPTARVAVQQLINEGMLVRIPGYSARVRTFDPSQVEDIYRVRKLIELDAVREIKNRKPPLHLVAEALEGFADLQKSEDDWSRIAEADVAFHASVVNSAGSARLQSYFSGITSEIRLLVAQLRDQYTGGAALYAEHEQLYLSLRDDSSLQSVQSEWLSHLDSAERFLTHHVAGTNEVGVDETI
ncbi:GntR family transcriptional regulator [Pseudoclavibacter terrae]|uniref:GntR family transcriptional regulator n=1 Tax=Pseudoclavibacter terrae TaxID=1530195 RepID=A0A7J5AXK1_9MICO|nr:GntR family transcriptional regulator [Pseudoclavibacter terrae]KAB1636105.1 GntR family transcriptional regulator [Pseudoclavibacter terrae]